VNLSFQTNSERLSNGKGSSDRGMHHRNFGTSFRYRFENVQSLGHSNSAFSPKVHLLKTYGRKNLEEPERTENQNKMAQFAPQYDLFKIIDNLRRTMSFVFWTIVILSASSPILKLLNVQVNLDDLFNTINIVALGSFFLLEIIVEYILIQADSRRRDDFLDNSFGSTFSPAASVGYYDNDEIQRGLYKAACNLFENCFFSYSLVSRMTLRKTVLPGTVLVLVIVSAYYGFKEVPFALSLLQALFSATLLGDLIKHLILLSRLGNIQGDSINLFQHHDLKTDIGKYEPQIYRLWLQYESLSSRIPPSIPNALFKKHNQTLLLDWRKLKARYNIC
jgi:hypothetical protein